MLQGIRRYFHERKYGENYYLVYSMGKVGSSTVYTELIRQFPVDAIQLHFLSDHWLKEVLPTMHDAFGYHAGLADEYAAHRKQKPNQRLKIITMVREPVIRDISDVFENWKTFFSLEKAHELTSEMVLTRLRMHKFEYTLNWFDNEFRNWTGIDIYNKPFDKEQGYSVWHFDAFDVLCIKLEKMDSVLTKGMLELGGPPLKQGSNANVATSKAIKDVYKDVSNKFRLSPEQENILLNSKYLNHFYTADEIMALKTRWSSNNV